MIVRFFSIVLGLLLSLSSPVVADEMRLAVTTSFHNSGLAGVLLPEIKKDLGLNVRLLVVGTGQALKLGRQGDVDAVLVHSRKAEEAFITNGYSKYRREIMYNDFVFIGPIVDNAKIKEKKTAVEVLKAVSASQQIFVSRGDDSGTHRKELSLWKAAKLKPETFSSSWYRASGSGMGATLNMASAMDGYVFADRASWLNFGNKRGLRILFSDDPALFNQYAYLPISATKHSHIKVTASKKLEHWLTGQKGQALIAGYKLSGEQLFVPNAKN